MINIVVILFLLMTENIFLKTKLCVSVVNVDVPSWVPQAFSLES